MKLIFEKNVSNEMKDKMERFCEVNGIKWKRDSKKRKVWESKQKVIPDENGLHADEFKNVIRELVDEAVNQVDKWKLL